VNHSDPAFRRAADRTAALSRPPSFLREGGGDDQPGAGMHVRIATRGSDLALTQARGVAARLAALGASTELVLVETAGDRSTAPFSAMPGTGFFTKAIQQAVLEGRADLAVHSHKDLPSAPVDGLEVAAVPTRADPRDVLVVRPELHDPSEGTWLPLHRGARVGTSAARRRHQLGIHRPDLELRELRGNVPTRIARLGGQELDAVVLAAAGLERLGLDLGDLVVVPLDPRVFVPAPAQGALALEARRAAADADLTALLTHLHDVAGYATVAAERGLMGMLQGGCQLALGAHAVPGPNGGLTLYAYYEGRTVAVEGRTAEEAAVLAFEALGRPAQASAPVPPDRAAQPGSVG
jgi:hydroxymethylbilane synthase